MQPLEKHYEAARTALMKGDDAQAKRELKLSLQDDPLHAQSHLLLASLYGREGDVDQAIVGFQRTMTLDPNNPVARYNLGTALLWRGEPVSAARQIEEAITAPSRLCAGLQQSGQGLLSGRAPGTGGRQLSGSVASRPGECHRAQEPRRPDRALRQPERAWAGQPPTRRPVTRGNQEQPQPPRAERNAPPHRARDAKRLRRGARQRFGKVSVTCRM